MKVWLLRAISSVHPHTHGELILTDDLFFQEIGSSPYTRGTRPYCYEVLFRTRFIPIHTGNSCQKPCLSLPLPVHPHTHGELAGCPVQSRSICGSSPYTRGTPTMNTPTEAAARFIPIHTGNSREEPARRRSATVHPHTHGELLYLVKWEIGRIGSSPYTRGTQQPTFPCFPCRRFIPIHTGNSCQVVCIRNVFPVHPHTHGELQN